MIHAKADLGLVGWAGRLRAVFRVPRITAARLTGRVAGVPRARWVCFCGGRWDGVLVVRGVAAGRRSGSRPP